MVGPRDTDVITVAAGERADGAFFNPGDARDRPESAQRAEGARHVEMAVRAAVPVPPRARGGRAAARWAGPRYYARGQCGGRVAGRLRRRLGRSAPDVRPQDPEYASCCAAILSLPRVDGLSAAAAML